MNTLIRFFRNKKTKKINTNHLPYRPKIWIAGKTLKKVTVDNDAFTRHDKEGVKAFSITGSFIDANYPAYTSVASNGDVSFFVLTGEVGTASGVMKSGLADITLESRKELKETISKLSNIILKKEKLKITNTIDEAYENPEDFKKTASATS